MKLLTMLMMAADLNGQPLPEVVLLDFHAAYCQPCQQMVPVLQRMEKDKFPIHKIDISERPDVSRQYNVDRIPTLILLVEGKEAQRFVGLTAEEELRAAMNKAARGLDDQRRAAGGLASPPQREDSAIQPVVAKEETAAPKGIRGLFDRMKTGLSGAASRDKLERPSYRAQSPDAPADTPANKAAMQATVRVRLIDGKMRDFGTGTIVYSTAGKSTILTCAHVFKGVSVDAAVVVDVFRDGEVLKYPATVIGGDHDSDVAFLKIQNTSPLPTAPIASQLLLNESDAVFSIGCNNGDLPTRMDMNVVAVNRYEGPENVVCTKDPIQGRSGGGLFNTSGELVGVCSGAFRKAQEGLYSGVKPIIRLASSKNLEYLKANSGPAFPRTAAAPDLMASVEAPFSSDDEMFDALINATPGGGFGATDPGIVPDFNNAMPQELPDPFSPSPAMTAMGPAVGQKLPTEITVIIDSKDPTKEKQVVVIPKPSPWLLRLLTGDSSGGGNSMSAGGTAFSATGSRRSAQRRLHP